MFVINMQVKPSKKNHTYIYDTHYGISKKRNNVQSAFPFFQFSDFFTSIQKWLAVLMGRVPGDEVGFYNIFVLPSGEEL